MEKRYLKIGLILFLAVVLAGLFIGYGAQAASDSIIQNLKSARGDLPKAESPAVVIGYIVTAALGFLVLIFFVMIIVAGFRWMTAGGNEETVKAAKKNITNAIIGVVIVIMSYAITSFVFNTILDSQ